jgi:hypothetical protein
MTGSSWGQQCRYHTILSFSFSLSFSAACSVSLSFMTEWRFRSRPSSDCVRLLCSLSFFIFVGLIDLFRLCHNDFRLNDGFGTYFRWDTSGFSALSPLLSLHRKLLPALSLCHFHSRLNGGFGAGFRRNTFRLLYSLSVYFSLSVSSDSVTFASLSLPTEWRLRSRLSMECIQLRKREIRVKELALLKSRSLSFGVWT